MKEVYAVSPIKLERQLGWDFCRSNCSENQQKGRLLKTVACKKKTVRSKRTFYAIQKHNKQTDVNLMKVRRVKILPAKDKGTVNFQIPLLTIIVTTSVQDNSSYLIRTTSRSPISVQHHRTTIDFFFNFNRRGI